MRLLAASWQGQLPLQQRLLPRPARCRPVCGVASPPRPRPALEERRRQVMPKSAWQLLDDEGGAGGGAGLPAKDAEFKEMSRRQQRRLSSFTWDRWAAHRSTSRYLRHMRGIFKSAIVRGLAQPLLYVGGLSTLLCVYEQLLTDGALPGWLPSLQMPTAPFDLTSFALALLLVFRTNTSFDRWDQACALWGTVANCAKDTLRQVISGLGPGDSPLPAAVCRWAVAYCRALKADLCQDSNLRAELEGILQPAELAQLAASYHPPSFALAVLSELVGEHARGAGLRESACVRLDESLSSLEGAVGACERILRTPIPLSYTRHTSRFLLLWLTCLPLCLWAPCHWATVPLATVIAFLLLGIEEIGVQIEEPFGLLPLDDICAEIEGDLLSMLQEAAAAKATASTAAGAAALIAATAAGGAASVGPALSSNIVQREQALFAAARRKLGVPGRPGAGTNGSASGSGPGFVIGPGGEHMEWSELGGRRAGAGSRGSSSGSIYESLDDGDDVDV